MIVNADLHVESVRKSLPGIAGREHAGMRSADVSLDCSGLSCPMPIVEISKAIRNMQPGETLEVIATDLAFQLDVEAWSRRTGHVIERFQLTDKQEVLIRVKSADSWGTK